ncbi:hypothetical protein [Flavobacterium sp. CAU 1735]|uniref:hypothetical protein n=1 Tax=Flavobacterium sp. CAU 1735 TaxID=3140361 RepID=UPI00325FEE3F
MIKIFKTSIKKPSEAREVMQILSGRFPKCKVSFDLEDCDKILRIENDRLQTKAVVRVLESRQHFCEELE